MESESGREPQLDYGCGTMLLIGVIMIGLISFNSFLVNQLLGASVEVAGILAQMPRLQRAFQIVGPVLILVFQYWVYDFFRDRLVYSRTGAKDQDVVTPKNPG